MTRIFTATTASIAVLLAASPVANADQAWACLWNGAFTFYGEANGSWTAYNGTEFSGEPFGLSSKNGAITLKTAEQVMRSSVAWSLTCEEKLVITGQDGVHITACWDKYGTSLYMDLVSGEGGVSSLMGAMNLRGNDSFARMGTFYVGKFTCTKVG